MKKIYMTPDTKVVNVNTEYLLGSGSNTQNVNVSSSNYTGGVGGVCSRQGGGSWDVDEDY